MFRPALIHALKNIRRARAALVRGEPWMAETHLDIARQWVSTLGWPVGVRWSERERSRVWFVLRAVDGFAVEMALERRRASITGACA